MVVAVVVVVGAGGIGLARLLGGDDAPAARRPLAKLTRVGSVVVPGGPAVEIARTPASYRVVYRLEEARPGKVEYRTDEVSVRRPFESRLETRSGRPPGTKTETFQAARFAKRVTDTGGSVPLVLELSPGVPPSDVRLAPVLEDALAAGRILRREVREVAHRRCQVYRSAGYLSVSELRAPIGKEYADSCVDEAGLVLEEVLWSGSSMISRRVAVEVQEGVALSDDLFPDLPATVAAASGGGKVSKLKEGSAPPGEFLVLDTPPEGFEHRGRYSVIPPQSQSTDPLAESSVQAGVVDVWVRGLDLLVLDQGATLRGQAPFVMAENSPRIDLGGFGQGEVRLSALGSEVRALREGGRYVGVSGTLRVDELAAVARSLRTGPGGTFELDDGTLG